MGLSFAGPVWSPYPPAVALPPRQMSYLAFLPYLLPSSIYAASLPQTAAIRPNDQLACIDEVMAGTDRADVTPYEELGRGNGSWAGIGREMRFTRELGQEARRIVGRVFGWGENQEGKGKKVSPSDDPLSGRLALLTLSLLSFLGWAAYHPSYPTRRLPLVPMPTGGLMLVHRCIPLGPLETPSYPPSYLLANQGHPRPDGRDGSSVHS